MVGGRRPSFDLTPLAPLSINGEGGNRTPAERAFDGWWGEAGRPRSGRLINDFRKNDT